MLEVVVRLFIHRENVKHFTKLLRETKDPARREVIRTLLAEEEEQLARCLRESQVPSANDANSMSDRGAQRSGLGPPPCYGIGYHSAAQPENAPAGFLSAPRAHTSQGKEIV